MYLHNLHYNGAQIFPQSKNISFSQNVIQFPFKRKMKTFKIAAYKSCIRLE